MTTFEERMLMALDRIGDALDALVLMNAPAEGEAVGDGCEHDWADLGGGDKQCRKCGTRE